MFRWTILLSNYIFSLSLSLSDSVQFSPWSFLFRLVPRCAVCTILFGRFHWNGYSVFWNIFSLLLLLLTFFFISFTFYNVSSCEYVYFGVSYWFWKFACCLRRVVVVSFACRLSCCFAFDFGLFFSFVSPSSANSDSLSFIYRWKWIVFLCHTTAYGMRSMIISLSKIVSLQCLSVAYYWHSAHESYALCMCVPSYVYFIFVIPMNSN